MTSRLLLNHNYRVPIRWVLMRCPDDDEFEPAALFSSNQDNAAKDIVRWFVLRWNIEVTFEEVRMHLGFETQRQWSDKAIARTSPCSPPSVPPVK